MVRAARLLPILLVALVSAVAFGTNGHEEQIFDGYKVVLNVAAGTATAPNWYVSGTNVDVAPVPTAYENSAGHPAGVLGLDLKSARLTIGGTEVNRCDGPTVGLACRSADGPGEVLSAEMLRDRIRSETARGTLAARAPSVAAQRTPPVVWNGLNIEACPVPVRFASTHFNDGDSVAIVYETVWQVSHTSGPPSLHTVTCTLTVNVYNRLQTLGTNKDAAGNSSMVAPIFISASNGVTEESTNSLTPSHHSAPGISALAETKATILARTEVSTVIAALTHGSVSFFRSSDYSETISFSDDIADIVLEREVPLYNMIGFWSCETLDDGAENVSPSVLGYGIVNEDGSTRIDRVYAGFTKEVLAFLYPKSVWDAGPPGQTQGSDYDLGHHADVFLSEIEAGKTIFDALEEANKQFPPLDASGYPWTKLDMVYVGDKRANLINVYLTQAEFDARVAASQPTNVWWVKL